MSISSNPPARALFARVGSLATAPRAAMSQAARLSLGAVLTTWFLFQVLWAAAAAGLLSTAVGRQALVDERVRVIESLGGSVDDPAYARLQAAPPYWVYFASGGRMLLAPPVTLAVAAGLFLWLRRRASDVTFTACLSVSVHATAALVVQQVVATPLHLARESLTSPFNLAALLPFFDEGSAAARFMGTIEVFGLWWVVLLAVGCATLAGRRARGFVGPLLGAYAGVAAVVAGAVLLTGGS